MSLPPPLSGVPAVPRRPPAAPAANDVILVVAVVLAGALAGYVVDAGLWLVTLLVAFMLVIASRIGHTRSDGRGVNQSDVPELPPDLRKEVNGALAQLDEGDARRMLMAVVQPARSWFGMRESSFDARQDDDTRRHVADLLAGSCAIALDLARLDAAAAPINTSSPAALRAAAAPAASHTAVPLPAAPAENNLAQRYQAARDLFAKRLADAASALSALYASGVERGTPASDRVAELVQEIREDASARTAAKGELDTLLGA
jgi:hypothetical protein